MTICKDCGAIDSKVEMKNETESFDICTCCESEAGFKEIDEDAYYEELAEDESWKGNK